MACLCVLSILFIFNYLTLASWLSYFQIPKTFRPTIVKRRSKDSHVPCSPLTPFVNVCICRMDQVIKLRPGSTSDLAFLMGSSQLWSKSQLVACPSWLGLAELTFLLTRVMLSLPVCWNRHRHGLGHREDIPVSWSRTVCILGLPGLMN